MALPSIECTVKQYTEVFHSMLAHSEAQAIVRTAIRNAGGVTKWARRFGIQRGSIYEWIERAEVPSDRAVIIERESCGVAKRQDLRPNDYWDWWPDLPRPNERE